jgi:hypothetical protein
MSIGAGADTALAVGFAQVVVSTRNAIAFYTNGGLKVFGVVPGITTSSWQPTDFWAASGFLISGHSYSATDMRTIFDPYRGRFWITQLVSDTTTSNEYLFCAVSVDGYATDGFYFYYWDPRGAQTPQDSSDYDTLGIGPTTFIQTSNWFTNGVFKNSVIFLWNADVMASGGSPNGWVFWNWTYPDGSTPVSFMQPASHHGTTDPIYLATKWPGHNNAVIFQVTHPLGVGGSQSQGWHNIGLTNPNIESFPDGPQHPHYVASAPPLGMGAQVGNIFLKSAWRAGKIYVSSNTAVNSLNSARMIRINTGTWGLEKDNVFAASTYSYGWPGVEVNQFGDVAILTTRTSAATEPEIRMSAYLHTDSSIEPDTLVKSGQDPYHEGAVCIPGALGDPGRAECWGETTGESVDPFDDTGIWGTFMFPVASGGNTHLCNYSMWVTRLWGSGGCPHSMCTQGDPLLATCDSPNNFVSNVCTYDSYCCATLWDSQCVSEVPMLTGYDCNSLPLQQCL